MLRISYNGLIADILEEDLQEGVAYLRGCSRHERRQILRSVEKALDRALEFVAPGRAMPTGQQLREIASDIGIWFAGEVLAGRAEQYKVVVQ